MAPLCNIYDADFGFLTEKHELGNGKEVTENVGFFLAESPYNVQSYRKYDRAKDSMFCPNDMKVLANDSVDVMKQESQKVVFLSTLYFALYYNAFPFQKRYWLGCV